MHASRIRIQFHNADQHKSGGRVSDVELLGDETVAQLSQIIGGNVATLLQQRVEIKRVCAIGTFDKERTQHHEQ